MYIFITNKEYASLEEHLNSLEKTCYLLGIAVLPRHIFGHDCAMGYTGMNSRGSMDFYEFTYYARLIWREAVCVMSSVILTE
jgi:hypothetical protein